MQPAPWRPAHQLARMSGADSAGVAGTVRITASQPQQVCYLLPPLLAQMRLALPQVQVALVASNAVSNLLRREADIAVRMVQFDQATLVAKRVGKVSLSACAHQDYLRRRGMPRQPTDLLAHELVGADRNEDILKGFAAMGYPVTREHFAFRTDDLIASWQAVRNGLGVGFMVDYLIRTDSAIVPLLPMLKIPPLPVWLAVHRRSAPAGASGRCTISSRKLFA